MIPFTQFLLPNGRRTPTEIERPAEIEAKARDLIAAGYRFEIEMLTTGDVHMDVSDDDGPIANEICANGPVVPDAVDRIVLAAHALLKEDA